MKYFRRSCKPNEASKTDYNIKTRACGEVLSDGHQIYGGGIASRFKYQMTKNFVAIPHNCPLLLNNGKLSAKVILTVK